MRSCATRSTKRNGPEHTGFAPNLSPAASAAFGDTIMPARSLSTDRKSTRLNSSHQIISYAVFCLKKKKESVETGVVGEDSLWEISLPSFAVYRAPCFLP